MLYKTPSNLTTPTFLMCPPFSISNACPNNVLMDSYINQEMDQSLAFEQFIPIYNYLAKRSMIYLLPHKEGLQDQSYVANLGCYLPHIDNPTILLANYKSPPRIGEDTIGQKFFNDLGYKVVQPPSCWEGEADLKHLRNNIYIAGYGMRTDVASHIFFQDKMDMYTLPIYMDDPKLYHLDCLLIPLNKETVLLHAKAINSTEIKHIEKFAKIIDIPEKFMYHGWTNGLVINGCYLYGYVNETKNDQRYLEEILAKENLEVIGFNMSEFDKSGAALSCLIMHLNYS